MEVAAQPPGRGIGPRDPINWDRHSIHGASRRIPSHPIRDVVRGETVGSASALFVSGIAPPSTRISAMALIFFNVAFSSPQTFRAAYALPSSASRSQPGFHATKSSNVPTLNKFRRSSSDLILDELERDPFTEDSRRSRETVKKYTPPCRLQRISRRPSCARGRSGPHRSRSPPLGLAGNTLNRRSDSFQSRVTSAAASHESNFFMRDPREPRLHAVFQLLAATLLLKSCKAGLFFAQKIQLAGKDQTDRCAEIAAATRGIYDCVCAASDIPAQIRAVSGYNEKNCPRAMAGQSERKR